MTTPDVGNIAAIRLGYVGLSLAVNFANQLSVVGFNINTALRKGGASTLGISAKVLLKGHHQALSRQVGSTAVCTAKEITALTPIDNHRRQDIPNLDRSDLLEGLHPGRP